MTSIFLAAAFSAMPQSLKNKPGKDEAGGCISAEEAKLASMLNAYRAEYNLPPIPISADLMVVAQTHVRDLAAHHPDQSPCNTHSWSADGPWTACCYTPDHRLASCMWEKPKELTGYKGIGFEIGSKAYDGASLEVHLTGWQSSTAHHDVILNLNQWRTRGWVALGVAVYGEYAAIWFGEVRDAKTVPPPCRR
jgi:hypothetical protein